MADVLGGFEHRVLLALLRLRGSTYSVPIVRELEAHGSPDVAPAAVYVTLRRLEMRGLLVSDMVAPEPGKGGRPRRVFTITEPGLSALRSAKADFESLWRGVEALDTP